MCLSLHSCHLRQRSMLFVDGGSELHVERILRQQHAVVHRCVESASTKAVKCVCFFVTNVLKMMSAKRTEIDEQGKRVAGESCPWQPTHVGSNP